jgi:gamma-glutamyltranspeptidase/glutathione hydrolase
MVGVPGFVAGLVALHQRGGRQPLPELIAPAVRLAEEGYPVTPWLAQTTVWLERELRRTPRSEHLFVDGALPRAGQTLKNPDLARTLREVATRGADAFRSGPVADDVVSSARAAASPMVGADLRDYQAIAREPLQVALGDRVVLVPPPPSAGGVMLAQQALAFPPPDVKALAPGSPDATHLVAEMVRASLRDRRAWIGDPAFTRADLGALLDPQRLREVRGRLPRDAVTPPDGPSIEDGGTCHLVAWDDADDVAQITTSIGGMFGARIMTRGGFFLGDSLADFAHDALGQRVLTKGPNFPRARARPASSMAPALVLEGGRPLLALGASGGARIPTSMIQVLHRVIVGGEPLRSAIDAPRWHAPSAGGLQIEAGLEAIAAELRARGEALEEPRPSFAAVTAIRADRSSGVRKLEGAPDPRKDGAHRVLGPDGE